MGSDCDALIPFCNSPNSDWMKELRGTLFSVTLESDVALLNSSILCCSSTEAAAFVVVVAVVVAVVVDVVVDDDEVLLLFC